MNLYDLKKDLQEKYPNIDMILRFTEACKKGYDISMIDGKPTIHGHVIYNRVQVEIEGQTPYLEKIQNHRQELIFPNFKSAMGAMAEAAVTDPMLKEVASQPEENQSEVLDKLAAYSLISKEVLEGRLADLKEQETNKKDIPIVIE